MRRNVFRGLKAKLTDAIALTCDTEPDRGSTFKIALPKAHSVAKARLPRRSDD